MEIRPIQSSEFEAARQLLLANGWDRKVATLAEFTELVARSPIALVAMQGNQVVGFLRALTDGLTNGYISMVVVHAQHRGQGIGCALVQAAMGTDESITWVLRATRSSTLHRFYEKLGFSVSSVAMERAAKKKPVA